MRAPINRTGYAQRRLVEKISEDMDEAEMKHRLSQPENDDIFAETDMFISISSSNVNYFGANGQDKTE